MRYSHTMVGFRNWMHGCLSVLLLAGGCSAEDDDGPSVADGTTSVDGTTASSNACEEAGVTASQEAFEIARDGAGGQYWYTTRRPVYDGFTPACFYLNTMIVEGGVVVERRVALEERAGNGDPSVCTTEDFVEVGDEVGTAEGPGIAPPALLETLYEGCCTEVIQVEPAADYDVTFEVDEAGMMSTCYWVQVGCADGCDGGPMGYGSIDLEAVGFGPAPS